MAITKRTELKEEILPNQVIQIRTTTVVEEDGVELARNHHRHVVVPGDDVTGEAQEVQDIAAALGPMRSLLPTLLLSLTLLDATP